MLLAEILAVDEISFVNATTPVPSGVIVIFALVPALLIMVLPVIDMLPMLVPLGKFVTPNNPI